MISIKKQQAFLADLSKVLKDHNVAVCSKTVQQGSPYTEAFFQMSGDGEQTNIGSGRLHNTYSDVDSMSGQIVFNLESKALTQGKKIIELETELRNCKRQLATLSD